MQEREKPQIHRDDLIDEVIQRIEARLQRPRGLKSTAFDLSHWHNTPGCNIVFVTGYGGMGVKIGCTTCRMLCDVEALDCRCSIADSYAHHGVEVEHEDTH